MCWQGANWSPTPKSVRILETHPRRGWAQITHVGLPSFLRHCLDKDCYQSKSFHKMAYIECLSQSRLLAYCVSYTGRQSSVRLLRFSFVVAFLLKKKKKGLVVSFSIPLFGCSVCIGYSVTLTCSCFLWDLENTWSMMKHFQFIFNNWNGSWRFHNVLGTLQHYDCRHCLTSYIRS